MSVSHRIGHVILLCGAFSLVFTLAFFAPLSAGSSQALGSSELITLTNQARVQLGGKTLNANSQLTSAAQAKAEDMARIKYFAHTAPDGKLAWDYLNEVGFRYEVAGENLAITNESAETVVTSWMNSPSHRDNITNGQYTEIGIGLAEFGTYQDHKNTTVIVALYAKEAPLQVVGATTNPAGGAAVLSANALPLSATTIASIAIAAMVVGGALELRHIRKVHRHTTPR